MFCILWTVIFIVPRYPGLVSSRSLTECVIDLVNRPYTETVALTNHGLTCQAWAAQYPHPHSQNNEVLFPADSSVEGASNYCRNFGGTGRPWCYTLHRNIIWEYCELQICGEIKVDSIITLTSSPGRIIAPDSVSRGLYDDNVDKLWIIDAPEGQIILFHLHFAQIRYSVNCYEDGLRVFEADLSMDHLLVCGNLLTEYDLLKRGGTRSSTMYVQFYSDFQLSGIGFELSYEYAKATNKSCDDVIKQPSGLITSPDWDSDGYYELNVNCLWRVEARTSYIIRFQVLHVAIQYVYGCAHADFLEISDTYGPLSLLCGFGGTRDPMETRSNVMIVQFESNNFLIASGFNLTYEAIQKQVEVCREVMHDPSGVIISPDSNGDGFYDNNANCFWQLEVGEDYAIRYTFETFSVEFSKDCGKDTVWIFECDMSMSKLAYCGFLQWYENMEGETVHNKLCIEFRSDDTNEQSNATDYLGFNITYSQRKVPDGSCGGTLRNSSGYITAPDVDADGYYDFNLFCMWFIQVEPGKTILYYFEYIRIERTATGCDTDYIVVIENISLEKCVICPFTTLTLKMIPWFLTGYGYNTEYTFCGLHETSTTEGTKTNELKVYFVSDSRLSHYGFNMSYREVESLRCEETITNHKGWIYPPDLIEDDKQYYYISCEWVILVQPGHALQFHIIFVRIEESDDCADYYLEILFIDVMQNLMYDTLLCGEKGVQPLMQIKTDWVIVYYLSRYSGNDFLIHFENIKVSNETFYHEFVGPSFDGYIGPVDLQGDGLYDYNIYMLWGLHTEVNKLIMMNILYIDIEDSRGCSKDFLSIASKDWTFLICGIGTKVVHTTTDNVAYILFHSDYSINKIGFNLTFTSIEGGRTECGAVLTGPSDVIGSPDQDGDGYYENFVNCLWTIQLHDDYVIVLHILEMDIQKETSNCKADYLEIYEEHRVIGKFCGSSPPAILTTEANTLYVHFVSNVIISAKGFQATYIQTQDHVTCSPGYQCLLTDVTILQSYLCDDYFDCSSGDDERFCDVRCPTECECHGLVIDCSGNQRCRSAETLPTNLTQPIHVPFATRRLDVSYNPHAFQEMRLEQQNLSWITHLNLSYCNIDNLPYSYFVSMKKLKILDLSYNRLRRLTSNMFESQSKLESLFLIGNLEMITFESESLSGLLSLQHLELSHLVIARITQNAFSGLDLMSLEIYHSHILEFDGNSLAGLSVKGVYFNSSKIDSFAEAIFDGVQNLEEFTTDEFKFCCVRPQGLPEDKCFPEKDEFSSCDDLIKNEILRPLIWIIGIFTILTNTLSVIYRFVNQKEQLKASYGIFVSNLAVSDGIMGLYLLIIATADVYFRNAYIFHDEYWRDSIFCKLAGVLSTTSTEASVFFICLITIDRLLIIKYPFGQVRLVLKNAWFLSVVVWILALGFAIIPVAIYPVFESRFYSQAGVCLALPISRVRPPGWVYAVSVFIGLNSIAYTFVAVGQWSIYREIKKASSSNMLMESRSKSRVDARVAKNLLLVVVTDLLCWLPVGVLGILALSDQAIEGEAYSWIAVVVLPVNAAVNPLLYTLSALIYKKKKDTIPEEDKTKESFRSGLTEQLSEVWHKSVYWQFSDQFNGFKKLADALEDDDIDVQARIYIAREIAALIDRLHSHTFIQNDLKADDIYVKWMHQFRLKIGMVLRLKHTLKQAHFEDNVSSLGQILEKLCER